MSLFISHSYAEILLIDARSLLPPHKPARIVKFDWTKLNYPFPSTVIIHHTQLCVARAVNVPTFLKKTSCLSTDLLPPPNYIPAKFPFLVHSRFILVHFSCVLFLQNPSAKLAVVVFLSAYFKRQLRNHVRLRRRISKGLVLLIECASTPVSAPSPALPHGRIRKCPHQH